MTSSKSKIWFAIFIVLTILSANLTFGFGVSSAYWKGNPLTISPGETKTAYLTLQNMVGTDDVEIKAEIIKGEEIATLDEGDYTVKAGTMNTRVPVKIKVPSDTPLDTTYVVTVSFMTVTSGAGGGVVLGTGADTTFDVLVVAATPKEKISPLTIGIIVAIIILLIIIIVIASRRKSNR